MNGDGRRGERRGTKMTRETMISTVVGMVGNHARVAAGILHSAGLIGSDAAGNADEIIAAA
ncbi:hypothetical protein LRR18_17525, partial [Mangrovimonas sp. AS39]|uniref:hypothetical protein n=1 Tax=Mangrovimonas futianensis TaxID=2895523 RepID=UPI001E41C487